MINIYFNKSKKTENGKNIPVYRQFLLSYCLLLISIIFVISIFSYSVLVKKLRVEVDTLVSNNMVVLRDLLDTRFAELDRIIYEVGESSSFMPYTLFQNEYVSDAISKLKSYRNANAYISDMVLYYTTDIAEAYNKEPMFFTADSASTTTTFWKYTYPFENWDYEEFELEVANIVTPKIRYPESVQRKNGKDKYMVYLCPMGKVIGNINQRGVVFFLIDQKYLDTMIQANLKKYQGTFSIYDMDGQQIYQLSYGNTTDNLEIPTESGDLSVNKPEIKAIQYNNIEFTRIVLSSENKQWTYVMDIPYKNYKGAISTNNYPFAIFAVSGVVLLLGLMVAYFLSKHNYQPIKSLLDVFSHYNKFEDASLSNIVRTFEELEQKNSNLQTQVSEQQYLYRLQFIQNLINGRFYTREQLTSQQKECSVVFPGSHYVVFVILIDYWKENGISNSPAYLEEVKYNVISTLEEAGTAEDELRWGVSLGPDQGIAMVLCLNSCEGIEQYYKKILESTSEYFKNNFGIILTTGIGNLYKEPLDIHLSYKEALDAVSFRFVQNDRIIIWDKVQNSYHNNLQWYPVKEEKQMTQYIIQGRYDLLENTVEMIYSSIYDLMLPPEVARGISLSLVNTIKRTLTDMKLKIDPATEKKMDIMLSMRYKMIWEFKEDLLKFCHVLCNSVKEDHSRQNIKYMEQIENYIAIHNTDSGLTLTLIAQHFNTTASYLTQYYKKNTGISLMQYLDNIRMENARKLLVETSLPLDAIIQQSGYVDKSNFIRKFRTQYGCTPIRFRNMEQQKL